MQSSLTMVVLGVILAVGSASRPLNRPSMLTTPGAQIHSTANDILNCCDSRDSSSQGNCFLDRVGNRDRSNVQRPTWRTAALKAYQSKYISYAI
jgi:hypothetical protein